MLAVALVWTYTKLAKDFYDKITQKSNERDQIVKQVFCENDDFDFFIAAEKEEAMMKKLMKRYERVELQYNVDDARKELASGYDKIRNKKQVKIEINEEDSKSPFFLSKQYRPEDEHAIREIFDKAEEEKLYKNLRDDLKKEEKKAKNKLMKDKVGGDQMLKLLKLNNFEKYERNFLGTGTEVKEEKTESETGERKETEDEGSSEKCGNDTGS
jgi:hypothetical protein